MNFRPTPLDAAVPIDLASEEAFSLGGTRITPSLLEMTRDGRSVSLEPRVMQVLTVLARRPGSVTSRDELVAVCWSGRFVGEDAIQRTIAKLRNAAEAAAGGDFFIETVPRVGYRLVLKGVPADAGEGQPPRPALPAWRRHSAGIAAIALVTVLSGALGWRALSTLERPPPSVRLAGFTAVGPNVPSSLPARVEAEVRAAFGAESSLLVREGSSDYLLRGTVQREGEVHRYGFRLTDARDGTEVWSTSRDVPLAVTDAPTLTAASAIIVLRCGLTGAADHHTRLPTHVMKLYLQFCEAKSGRTRERAMDSARRLVAEVPDFANGWAGLANAAASATIYKPDSPETRETVAEGEAAAARALRLDRRNAMAFDALAMLKPRTALVEKEVLFRKAIAARPMDCGCEHHDYGMFLMSVGRAREAAEHFRRSTDIMPLNQNGRINEGLAYLVAGDMMRAKEVFDPMIATADPVFAREFTRRLAQSSGRWTEAAAAANVPFRPPARTAAMIAAYEALAAGDPQRKAAAVQGLLRVPPAPGMVGIQPQLLAELGARDAALAAVAAEDSFWRLGPSPARFDPSLQPLRDDPAYVRQLETTGLMDYWRRTGTRPDMCGEPRPAAFCARL